MVSLAKDPKYLQMAEKFRNEILSGVYQQGSRLPSDEIIANAYGINKRTVAAGMAQLVAEGLISRTPGRVPDSFPFPPTHAPQSPHNVAGLSLCK